MSTFLPRRAKKGSGRVNKSQSTNALERPTIAMAARMGILPHTKAQEVRGKCGYGQRKVQFNGRNSKYIQTCWEKFPTQSPVCRGNDGLPFDVDDLAISFPKWRAESIKAYGNAIVPQVAYEIFKAIETINKNIIKEE